MAEFTSVAVVWSYDAGEWWVEHAAVGEDALPEAEGYASSLEGDGELVRITVGMVPEPASGAAHPLPTHQPTTKTPK